MPLTQFFEIPNLAYSKNGKPKSFLFSKRYPFAGLAISAISGILLGNYSTSCFWPLVVTASVSLLICTYCVHKVPRCEFTNPKSVQFHRNFSLLLTYFCIVLLFAASQQWEKNLQPGIRDTHYLANRSWEIDGNIVSEPQQSKTHPNRSRFTLETTSWNNSPLTLPVLAYWQGPPPQLGDRVRIYAYATPIEPPRNPGEFDRRNWMLRSGITLELRATSKQHCEIVATQAHSTIYRWALYCRNMAAKKITAHLQDAPLIAALIQGVTLGGLHQFDEVWKERFRQTGTLHLFSVSGLHVGMIASILWVLLYPLRFPPKLRALIIILFLITYACITGVRPSCVRATTIVAIFLAGAFTNRPPQALNSLCAAAFLILFFNPQELFNPGFQLSFFVVATLIAFASPIQHTITNCLKPDSFLPRPLHGWRERLQLSIVTYLAPALSVTCVAWIASLLLVKTYYHLISWVAIPLNLLLIPIAFLILATALTSILLSFIFPAISILFNNANFFFAWLSLHLVQFGAAVPLSHTYANWFTLKPSTEVIVFDFGDHTAQLITTRHANLLIDTGNEFETTNTLLPHLRSQGITHIHLLVFTQNNGKHVGGTSKLIEMIRVDQVVVPADANRSRVMKRLINQLQSLKIHTSTANSSSHLQISDELSIEFVDPLSSGSSLLPLLSKDNCVISRVVINHQPFVFFSNATFFAKEWIQQNYTHSHPSDIIVTKPTEGAIIYQFDGTSWIIKTFSRNTTP